MLNILPRFFVEKCNLKRIARVGQQREQSPDSAFLRKNFFGEKSCCRVTPVFRAIDQEIAHKNC